MKKMFVLFCMLFSCAFSLAAVNINAASQQELEALPGIRRRRRPLRNTARKTARSSLWTI